MSDPVLNSDVSADEARALHRVVRAMHDGNCPKCGHVGPDDTFKWLTPDGIARWECPKCRYSISAGEAEAAMEAFRPYMQANVEVFEKWRANRR